MVKTMSLFFSLRFFLYQEGGTLSHTSIFAGWFHFLMNYLFISLARFSTGFFFISYQFVGAFAYLICARIFCNTINFFIRVLLSIVYFMTCLEYLPHCKIILMIF